MNKKRKQSFARDYIEFPQLDRLTRQYKHHHSYDTNKTRTPVDLLLQRGYIDEEAEYLGEEE